MIRKVRTPKGEVVVNLPSTTLVKDAIEFILNNSNLVRGDIFELQTIGENFSILLAPDARIGDWEEFELLATGGAV